MKSTWRTYWQHNDIVVLRDEHEADRIASESIHRVFLLCGGRGETPGDVEQTVVELAGDAGFVVFAAETGFAGRVNFERDAFWRERACVHWIASARASLPLRLRLGGAFGARASAWKRLPHDALAAVAARWAETPAETWEARKRRRIEQSRPFGFAARAAA